MFIHIVALRFLFRLRIIRINNGCKVRIEKSARGSLFGITILCLQPYKISRGGV